MHSKYCLEEYCILLLNKKREIVQRVCHLFAIEVSNIYSG